MALSSGPNAGLLINGADGEEHYLELMRAWRGWDGLVQCHVLDKDLVFPPAFVDGAMYLVPAGAQGAWQGRTGRLARAFTVGVGAPNWEFYTPKAGWSVIVVDERDANNCPIEYRYNGVAWVLPDLGPSRDEIMVNPMTAYADLIYGDEDGTPVRLPKGEEGQYLRMIDGTPTWIEGSGGGSGEGMINPMTAPADMIVGGAAGAARRLPKGNNGQVLSVNGDTLQWIDPPAGTGDMTNPMTTALDIIVAGPNGVPMRLAIGGDGQILKRVGDHLAWADDATGGGTGEGMVNPMTAAGDLIVGGGGGVPTRLPKGTANQVLGVDGWFTPVTPVPASDVGVNVASLSGGKVPTTQLPDFLKPADKGVANGVATLDASGTVPASQLPSYVDDVLEFTNRIAFPNPGETGKIYVALDSNRQYRWSGSNYVELVASPGTTDNVPEGTTNRYWTAARTLGQVLTGLVTSTAGAIASTDTILVAMGKLQNAITTISSNISNFAAKGVNSDITSLTAIAANFVAATTGIVLGSAAVPWAQLFLGKLTMSGAINNAGQVTLAIPANGIVNIAAVASNSVILTGTVGIGSLGATPSTDVAPGVQRWVRFANGCDIYHSAALVLPGAVNITTRANDVAVFECTSAGWRMQHFMRADGTITYTGGTLSKSLNLAPSVTLASAGNLALESVEANTVRVTGTAYIGSLGNLPVGSRRRLVFDGAASLAASSAMVLPGGANITATVGDVAEFEQMGAGAWLLTDYMRATGEALGTVTGGTNSNGSWTRMPDGTLMQMMSVVIAGPTVVGSITSPSLTFPVPFYDLKVSLTSNVQTSLPSRFNTAAAINSVTQYVASISDTGGGISNATVQVIAIGRWKA